MSIASHFLSWFSSDLLSTYPLLSEMHRPIKQLPPRHLYPAHRLYPSSSYHFLPPRVALPQLARSHLFRRLLGPLPPALLSRDRQRAQHQLARPQTLHIRRDRVRYDARVRVRVDHADRGNVFGGALADRAEVFRRVEKDCQVGEVRAGFGRADAKAAGVSAGLEGAQGGGEGGGGGGI